MSDIETLHTAARRYCLDQSRLWHERYGANNASPNSEEARGLFSRYLVVEAILVHVERKTADDFDTVDEARAWLTQVGASAQNYDTRQPVLQQGAGWAAMAEERARFCGYIMGFADAQAGDVQPLPYHRTISPDESRTIWAALTEKWGIGGSYWYPLAGDAPPHTIALHAEAFETHFGAARLQRLLADLGVTRMFELSEDPSIEEQYEVDLACLAVSYGKGKVLEAFWTPRDQEWVIYVSHEDSLTLTGERLVAALQAQWPEWEQYRYLTPFASSSAA